VKECFVYLSSCIICLKGLATNYWFQQLKSLIHPAIYIAYVHLARTKQNLSCLHHSIPASHKWTINVAPLFPHVIAKQHRNFLFQSAHRVCFLTSKQNSTEMSYFNPPSLRFYSSHHSKTQNIIFLFQSPTHQNGNQMSADRNSPDPLEANLTVMPQDQHLPHCNATGLPAGRTERDQKDE
jgi:hypothetical protein